MTKKHIWELRYQLVCKLALPLPKETIQAFSVEKYLEGMRCTDKTYLIAIKVLQQKKEVLTR